MRKILVFSAVLSGLCLLGATLAHAQSSVLNATGGSFEGYDNTGSSSGGDPLNYQGGGQTGSNTGAASQGGSSNVMSYKLPDGRIVQEPREMPKDYTNYPVTVIYPDGRTTTLLYPQDEVEMNKIFDEIDAMQRKYVQTEEEHKAASNPILGMLRVYAPDPPPYALPTNLLGNTELNNTIYTQNTWANPPWNTPYQSSADSRSWISQMPNGQGYSTTLGFQAPYSGGHGPLVSDSYANVDITFDPLGRAGLPTPGAPYVANIVSGINSTIAQTIANSMNHPSLAMVQTAALVQAGILPLHFLITWGANAYDLDLHVTGPMGINRFHIFYGAPGGLTNDPHAKLIDDCVSANCAEVVRIEQLNGGGVYRASVYNYGNPSTSGTNLSSDSGVVMMVVRGGTVGAYNGTTDIGSTVTGGEILYHGSPTPGEAGNTWTAFELDPDTGAITFVNQMGNSDGHSTTP